MTFIANDVSPLAAEKLFTIGPLPITNSMIFGILTALFVLLLFGLAAKASQVWPKSKLSYWFETFTELVFGLIVESFGDRKRAARFFPLLMTLFVFILACNLSGLLPGVETLTYNVHGEPVSFLRAFTTDLNSTLAMAIVAIGTVYAYAFSELSLKQQFGHYFSPPYWNPFNWFIGINEIFSELLRLVTLTLRLFGVIYGGEALLHAISSLAGNFAPVATLPIMFLEIFVSIVQAYLFMMLTASYLVMAVPDQAHKKEPVAEPAGS